MTATAMSENTNKTPAEVVVIGTTTNGRVQTMDDRRDSVYERMKSRVTKKRLIFAMTTVCVVAIVVAGILVGVKFHLDAVNSIVQRKYELETADGKKVAQEVKSDLIDNIVQYHTQQGDSESWTINDFNREIQITKSKLPTSYICYITPFNRSSTATPEIVQNATQPTSTVVTTTTSYSVLPTAIIDKSILGTQGQKLCNNVDVYWIKETCEQLPQNNNATAPTGVAGRQKRSPGWHWQCRHELSCNVCCHWWCFHGCCWWGWCCSWRRVCELKFYW